MSAHNAESVVVLGVRWFCPNCEAFLRKPPKIHDGKRYHSWKCRPPMILVTAYYERHSDGRGAGDADA